MEIRLQKLKITSFKGIKSFEYEFDGKNATIKGANGTGKTTVYDSFLWLLFGKDSAGRTKFNNRPLDKHNKPIRSLAVAVEADIVINGTLHTFSKEQTEKVIKGRMDGYNTERHIDEGPKKETEYNDYIKSVVDEDVFKLLTDLHFFNGKMKWPDRRSTLIDIAGETGTPKGFDELIAAMNGRDIDEYKDVLRGRKKKLTKEQAEINPRIDELQRGLDEYSGGDNTELEKRRESIHGDILLLDNKRQLLFTSEKDRQRKIGQVNTLKAQKTQREAELKSDTSGVKKWIDEKAKLFAGVSARRNAVNEQLTEIERCQAKIETCMGMLEAHTTSLNMVRKEYADAEKAPHDLTCYACGQKLPADKVTANEEGRKSSLAKIIERGEGIKNRVDAVKKEMVAYETEKNKLKEVLERCKIELKEATDYEAANLDNLNESIANNKILPPGQDEKWRSICKNISEAETEIGEPVSEQLQKIDDDRTAKNEELKEINSALSKADTVKDSKARIIELDADNSRIAQQLADIEKQLNDIEGYKADESRMIESAVNGMFKHTKFKLFKKLINGGMEDCCEATLDGIPYPDMSYGQKILVGIDIINVLSAHYGLSIPLFIDNSESLTYPVEFTGQTILLAAQKSARKLIIEKK